MLSQVQLQNKVIQVQLQHKVVQVQLKNKVVKVQLQNEVVQDGTADLLQTITGRWEIVK